MAFDTNAAVQGGLTGASIGGPAAAYTAAAGFVLGGFLGGSYAAGNKKQRRTLERKIRRRQDPAYLKRRIQEYTPIARQAVLESGAGNSLQQEVQSNISKRGLTGTGVGTAFQNAAALAPSQFAAQTATNLATNSIDNEINSIVNMGSYNPQDIATLSRQSAGDIATAIAIFRSLKGRNQAANSTPNAPSSGTATSMGPGRFDPYNLPTFNPALSDTYYPSSNGSYGRFFPGARGGY